ncbi:hypothetical protein, partial [Methylibium sp.]|uniref:hypothetical protein n=1 Tax=Methylibium sp. TaxID=2067992 RepID=UPI0025F682A6
ASCETSFRWFLSLLARHLHFRMQAKGTATSAHAFNNFWDIAGWRLVRLGFGHGMLTFVNVGAAQGAKPSQR